MKINDYGLWFYCEDTAVKPNYFDLTNLNMARISIYGCTIGFYRSERGGTWVEPMLVRKAGFRISLYAPGRLRPDGFYYFPVNYIPQEWDFEEI